LPDAVILLAKGGTGDWPQQELEAMVAAVRATCRYECVEGAFLDLGAPSFPRVLRQCAAAGARRIVIAPVFIPMDRSLREWLPKIVRRTLKRYHLDGVEVVLAAALGDHLGEAVAQAVAAAEQGEDVRAGAPPKDVADRWIQAPAHRYHAFVCEGPRCATLGSHELWVRLRERIEATGLGRENPLGVLSVRTSCLYPCNLGPMMVVHPDGCWYGALDERAIDQIVDQHFGAGRPVEQYLRPRPRRAATTNGSAGPSTDKHAAAGIDAQALEQELLRPGGRHGV
jgi:(2Fe-2S) ferredoxin